MFDVGWSEMAVIAVVALLVIGPKELPNALRTVAQWVKTARKLAREFQGGIDEIVREAELDEAKKTLHAAQAIVKREIESNIDPTGEVKRSLQAPSGDAKQSPPTTAVDAPAASSPVNGGADATIEAVVAPVAVAIDEGIGSQSTRPEKQNG